MQTYPTHTTTLVLEARASWSEIEQLQGHPLGLQSFFPSQLLEEPPIKRIAHGVANISLTRVGRILSYEYVSKKSVFTVRKTDNGPFSDLIVDINNTISRTIPIEQQSEVSTTWIVDLRLNGMQVVVASEGLMNDDGAGHLMWLFPPGSTVEHVSVQAAPSWAVRAHLALGTLGDLELYIEVVLGYLSSGIVLFVLLIILPKLRSVNTEGQAQVKKVKHTLLWSLLIPGIGIVLGIRIYFPQFLEWTNSSPPAPIDGIFNSLFGVGCALYLASTYKAGSFANSMISGSTCIALIILNLPGLSGGNILPSSDWLLVLVLIIWCMFTYFLVSGIVRHAKAVWASSESDGRPKLPSALTWVEALIAVIAIFSPLQWLFFSNEGNLGTMRVLSVDALVQYPFQLLWVLTPLLPFLALIGLISVLRAIGRNNSVYSHIGEVNWAAPVVAILAAGFVATSGSFFGLNLPIAFAVTFVFVLFIFPRFRDHWHLRLKDWESKQDGSGLAASATENRREEMVRQARQFAFLERKQAKLYEEHSKAEKTPEDFDLENLDLETQKSKLPLADMAFAFGPGTNWWENGKRAVQVGWILALLPALLYLYALLTQSGWQFLSLSSYFGPLNLLIVVLQEIAFWVVAAFLLGCLYPYLPGSNGGKKGFWLSLIFLVSQIVEGLRQILLGEISYAGVVWAVLRFLLLLLYLWFVGFLMDREILRDVLGGGRRLAHGRLTAEKAYWAQLVDLYRFRDIKAWLGYLAPLAVALIAVSQLLTSGEAPQAVVEVVKSLPLIPPGHTAGLGST